MNMDSLYTTQHPTPLHGCVCLLFGDSATRRGLAVPVKRSLLYKVLTHVCIVRQVTLDVVFVIPH